MANRVLRKRFSDTELQDIQAKVSERAAVPTVWRSKLNRLLTESPRPALRSLRALLAEGDRINYPLSELHSLRKCVTKANDWVDSANTFIVRKPTRKRPRKSRGRSSAADSTASVAGDDGLERPERTLDDLYALLKEVENLGFDCPEIASLKGVATEAEETRAKARTLLDSAVLPRGRDSYVHECERLIVFGSNLNVLIDELLEVEKIVLREQLLKELEDDVDDDTITLEDVRQYVSRARSCNLSPENSNMKHLETLLRAGEAWEARAKALMEKPQRTLEELDEFAKPKKSGVPVDPELLEHILQVRYKAKEIEKQAKSWLTPEAGAAKPKVPDVMKLVSRAEKEFNIPAILDLKRTVDFAHDLESRCEAVLKGRYQHTEEGDIFNTMLQWRKYAKEHLTMFYLTHFEKLDKQLSVHFRWLEGLPWYCKQHGEAHGQPILDDVVESTRPEDDLPPSDEYFTCICTNPVRPPAPGTVSDAVQCDHCFARFHGVCAANGGSCPFCDHHHWNGAIHKERSWHFCYLPTILLHAPDITRGYSEEWKQLEIIVHRVDRLSAVIGQFLSFASQPTNQRQEYIPQVRHYMRKLYKIQFAVSPNPEVSFGLDLAGLHRILAGQPQVPVRMKKRRRPKFVFGQDIDKDWLDGTRCICRGRTTYLLNYPTVECELCGKLYHAGCVFYPLDHPAGWTYPFSEVRVRYVENPNPEPEVFVDTKEMLDTFSKDIILMKLPQPYTQTLFVELMRFTPGQPDNVAANGIPTPRMPGPSNTQQSSSPFAHTFSRTDSTFVHWALRERTSSIIFSPWSPTSALGKPVEQCRGICCTAYRENAPWSGAAKVPRRYTSQTSRKRKYPDDPASMPDERLVPPAPVSRSPKRHHAAHTPQPSASRANQGLSPSLAMMLSPSPVDIRSPPRQPSGSYASRGMVPSPTSSRMPDDRPPNPPHGQRRVKLVYTDVNVRPDGHSRGHGDERWAPGPAAPLDGRSPQGSRR
ncbi:Multicopy suppressor of chk1 protein 1 [Grifola frondosa]|uniref:Multicopy suppressor of chk1 protein 1 n=1 Tax=Grifola frondosa TaxID=5627 RepID=A0A1C7M1B5_GRIFR|nr:Multicopy suppressor of chk1 protein 1 [Grifola frondosa]